MWLSIDDRQMISRYIRNILTQINYRIGDRLVVVWEDGVEGKMVTVLTPNYGSGYTNLYVLKFMQIYVKKSQCSHLYVSREQHRNMYII